MAILFSLAGPAPVLAEAPAVSVKPLEVQVVPAGVESAAQQAAEAMPSAAVAAGAGAVQQQMTPETAPTADTGAAAAPAQTPAASAAPAADVQPVTEAHAAPAAPETPSEAVIPGAEASGEQAREETPAAAAGAEASSPAMPGVPPCPMYRKGMMMPGGGPPGVKMYEAQRDMVKRLDMIEARMAKIEAMLERLMKR